jgi:valyl-tRNA synthetase
VAAKENSIWLPIQELLCKQVNAKAFSFTNDAVAETIQLVIGGDKFYVKADQVLDTSIQRKELETELAYFQGFLESVEKKLSNEKFVSNAKPEVVEMERKKQADAQDKIKMLQEGLANLG